MGFDLSGIKPRKHVGEYFRNNVWWWRPLWMYISSNCVDILSKEDVVNGNWNNGKIISKIKSEKIAKRLRISVENGNTKKYEKKYINQINNLPDVECASCKGTGKQHVYHIPNSSKKCNSCDGAGKRRPFECSYPFSEENVKDFIEFAENSGGFIIS